MTTRWRDFTRTRFTEEQLREQDAAASAEVAAIRRLHEALGLTEADLERLATITHEEAACFDLLPGEADRFACIRQSRTRRGAT